VIALAALQGCAEKRVEKKGAEKKMPAAAAGEAGPVLLEFEEIDLMPKAEKKVAVKSGKAENAEAPKDSGLMVTMEGDMLIIAATEAAKEGTHHVMVKGKGKSKEAMLMVHVKKGAPGMMAEPVKMAEPAKKEEPAKKAEPAKK
jgi:hypothetical protein